MYCKIPLVSKVLAFSCRMQNVTFHPQLLYFQQFFGLFVPLVIKGKVTYCLQDDTSIPDFRFKAYLKSNLERLYRDEDGNITWTDRNGNRMKPVYEDTDQDGNYDTFTWQYEEAYGGKTVDFQAFIFCGDCYSSGFSASDWREPEDCEGRAESYGYQGRDCSGAVCPSVRVGAGSVCDSGDSRV